MTRTVVIVAIAIALAIPVLAVGAIFASYLATAMVSQSQESPIAVTCTPVAAPKGDAVLLRFDAANAAKKDATWINLALFVAGTEGKNVSDWGYQLETPVPARGKASKTLAVPLPPDYRALKISIVRCTVVNAVFADGSEERYGARTDAFP